MASVLKRREIPANWDGLLLVCAKCSKKVGGGFGPHGRTPLAKALRKLLGLKKGRKAAHGVVDTRCLGLCPRGAVTLIDPRRPGEWLIAYPGDDLRPIAVRLRPAPEPQPARAAEPQPAPAAEPQPTHAAEPQAARSVSPFLDPP